MSAAGDGGRALRPIAERRPLADAEVAAVLEARVSAMLAFIGHDGYPRQVPCWFLWHADAFHVASQAGKYHVRRLGADPRASICVEVERRERGERVGYEQVKGIGDVRVLADPDGAWRGRIVEKYLGERAREWPRWDDGVVLRLEPVQLAAHTSGRARRRVS